MTRQICPVPFVRRMSAALICAVALGGLLDRPVHAQTSPVTLNYAFNVPVLKLVPNPCTNGFALVDGAMAVSITTSASSAFALKATFNSSGRADDARVDGTVISDGTQKPAYLYTSSVSTDSNFPNGKPAYFMQTLNVTDYLVRSTTTDTGDSFLVNAVFKLTFNNGIPELPVLQRIDVACAR